MHSRRDWLRSSLGIGGLLLAPPNILSAQEKIDSGSTPCFLARINSRSSE